MMVYPLFLEPVMQEKIWGGKALKAVFGYDIPSEQTGECWAISAHPHGISKIKNGLLQGRGLDQVYQEYPELFAYPEEPVFPLLTKILDANDWLSVQVHPDDNYALDNEGELGKTECWYILSAQEGAEIIYGHQASSKEELEDWIKMGEWDRLLTKIPVKAGDFFYVPSGTIHAIGKGIMILETQQSSDTTYRVYDFDRQDDHGKKRQLHIEDSVAVSTIGKPSNSYPVTFQVDALTSTILVSNPFFAVYRWQVNGKAKMAAQAPYLLVSVINGSGSLLANQESYPLQKGDHFILPNGLADWVFEGDVEMIVSHVGKGQE